MATKQTTYSAYLGGWIEARGLCGQTARRGQIVELMLIGSDSHERYRECWDETHESIV